MSTEPSIERTLDEVLAELNELQTRFVFNRVNTRFDYEAAELTGCHEKTPYKWRQDGLPIDEAILIIRRNAVREAQRRLTEAGVLAADVLIEEMQTRGGERMRAALETLNRIGLPATSKTEVDIDIENADPLVIVTSDADLQMQPDTGEVSTE